MTQPENLNEIAGSNPIEISGDPVIQTEVDMLCLLADFPEKLQEVRSLLTPDMISNSKVGQVIKNFLEQNIVPTHSIVEEIINDPVYQIKRSIFKITDVEYVLQSLLHNYKVRYLTYKLPNKLLHSDYSQALSEMERAQEITTRGVISKEIFDTRKTFEEANKFQMSNQKIYKTGIPSIDKVFVPAIMPSNLITVAADTGVGKTLFVTQVMENITTMYDEPIVWFSLEMPKIDMTNRRIALYLKDHGSSAITNKTICSTFEGELDFNNASTQAEKRKVYMVDNVFMFNDICNYIRNLAHLNHRFFVIDYLQLVVHHNFHLSDLKQLENMIITLKRLCNQYNIIIFAISQFHRKDDFKMTNSAKIIKRTPELSDLKGSSSIEQNSDRVIMLWCEPSEMEEIKEERYVKVLMKKNRFGNLFSTWVLHHRATGRMESVSDEQIKILNNTANAENNKGEKHNEHPKFHNRY